MITAQIFPKIELTEEMAKLLFHSIIAETHSISSTDNYYLQVYTSRQNSSMMSDINVRIVYKDKYKSCLLDLMISKIRKFHYGYKIEHTLLSDNWNRPILDENSCRKNPSTRNAIYAYIEKVKSTDLEIPNELSNIFPTHKQPSPNIPIFLKEKISRTSLSTEYRYYIEDTKYFSLTIITKENDKITEAVTRLFKNGSLDQKISHDTEEYLDIIRNMFIDKITKDKTTKQSTNFPSLQTYFSDRFVGSDNKVDLKSYNKVSIHLLPLKWNGIEYDCADPVTALTPQFDNEKFKQIHENKEAIIVDIEELQELNKILTDLSINHEKFNSTIKYTHTFNKRLKRVSPEETLKTPQAKQHKPDTAVDPSEQNFSATDQPMEHDAPTQTTETDIGVSSATPLTQNSSKVNNEAVADVVFPEQQQVSASPDHFVKSNA